MYAIHIIDSNTHSYSRNFRLGTSKIFFGNFSLIEHNATHFSHTHPIQYRCLRLTHRNRAKTQL